MEVSRRIDRLGRIALPMDLRKALGLNGEAKVVIGISEKTITIKSAIPSCRVCGAEKKTSKLGICPECIRKIKAVCD